MNKLLLAVMLLCAAQARAQIEFMSWEESEEFHRRRGEVFNEVLGTYVKVSPEFLPAVAPRAVSQEEDREVKLEDGAAAKSFETAKDEVDLAFLQGDWLVVMKSEKDGANARYRRAGLEHLRAVSQRFVEPVEPAGPRVATPFGPSAPPPAPSLSKAFLMLNDIVRVPMAHALRLEGGRFKLSGSSIKEVEQVIDRPVKLFKKSEVECRRADQDHMICRAVFTDEEKSQTVTHYFGMRRKN